MLNYKRTRKNDPYFGLTYRGQLMNQMVVVQLRNAVSELLVENDKLRASAKLQFMISEERLYGKAAGLREINFNKLMKQLQS